MLDAHIAAFAISTGVVALAEIADKTQLLALVLAARYRRPWPIIWGILVATLANHFVAGLAGVFIARTIGDELLRWGLALSFLAMAAWMMIPDRLDVRETPSRLGVFGTTAVAFFLVEIGDKTQIATVALAAKFETLAAVVVGTTLGMMIANVPAVLLGNIAADKLPVRLIHGIAAFIFALLGVMLLFGVELI